MFALPVGTERVEARVAFKPRPVPLPWPVVRVSVPVPHRLLAIKLRARPQVPPPWAMQTFPPVTSQFQVAFPAPEPFQQTLAHAQLALALSLVMVEPRDSVFVAQDHTLLPRQRPRAP